MTKLALNEVAVTGKKVFLRVDFNVPMDGDKITDDTRIRATLPTINYLLEHGARVIIASHFGRPKGLRNEAFSLAPVARYLEGLLGRQVLFVPDCVGVEALRAVDQLNDGDALMLENLRFYPGEESGDLDFARQLA
ncbi:MAG TPA: phosphoglycerate kinase, partial [Bacillota bacterium]|nr:phosphoglycerate kinase [Bacillota bacterium]